MQLLSLIGHCSQLFSIIWKSSRPADEITSQYFRGKKYIGSKERRFVSEIVFYTLRLNLFADGILERFNQSKPIPSVSSTIYQSLNDPNITAKIISIILILNYDTRFNERINIKELLTAAVNQDEKELIGQDNGFDLLIENTCKSMFQIPFDLGFQFIPIFIESYTTIKDKFHGMIDSNYHTNKDLITFYGSIPIWILNEWAEIFQSVSNYKEAFLLAQSLMFPADVCLRVNTNSIKRKNVLKYLEENGIPALEGKLTPDSIILKKRVNLNEYQILKDGWVEVQDEGSQLISYALSPHPGDNILDACAGAGGKTMHIAALMKDSGKITASDTEYNRLKEISHRAARAGFKSIKTKLIKGGKLQDIQEASFDAVLIDAPCSGMGTVRRMPMAKWRLTPEMLKRHSEKQYGILSYYSEFVKHGGSLVYSTCSLMPQENSQVIQRFLDNNPDFYGEPLGEIFAGAGLTNENLMTNDSMITLYPHIFGCDGFFIARMRRK
jgi:16S rRNA (cytosine967-C5)-methyltransferase